MAKNSRSYGRWLLFAACSVLAANAVSCGVNPNILEPADICHCISLGPDAADYRHVAKHVPIPNVTAIETDVPTILTWHQDIAMPPDAPRTGRELQVYHVAKAYLQNASVNSGDCDLHMEISATASKTDPRVVIETPVDSEYCSARQGVQALLSKQGFKLDNQNGGEVPQAVPVQVTGLAFEDFEHNRGSAQIGTVWELHPAIVTAQ